MSSTPIRLQKIFLVESRLNQLSSLRKTIKHLNMFSQFKDILNEIKNLLVHFKLNLFKDGYAGYKYISFIPPIYLYDKDITYEVIDKMVFIFLQTVVKEFDVSTYYDSNDSEILNAIIIPNRVYIYSYEQYLQNTVSDIYFEIWKKKRNTLFIPNFNVSFIPKNHFHSLFDDTCGICMNKHIKKDTITINCSHHFGYHCFNDWMNICKNNGKETTCPICRNEVTSITSYDSLFN